MTGSALPASAAASVDGAGGIAGTSLSAIANATTLSGIASTQLQSLINAIQGFSSAEILMALMLMSAQDKGKGHGDTAMGLLAGLALAGQLSQIGANISISIPGIAGTGLEGAAGLQINLQI